MMVKSCVLLLWWPYAMLVPAMQSGSGSDPASPEEARGVAERAAAAAGVSPFLRAVAGAEAAKAVAAANNADEEASMAAAEEAVTCMHARFG